MKYIILEERDEYDFCEFLIVNIDNSEPNNLDIVCSCYNGDDTEAKLNDAINIVKRLNGNDNYKIIGSKKDFIELIRRH